MYISWTPLKRPPERQQTNKLIGNKLRLYFLTSELVCKSRIEGPCMVVGRSGQGPSPAIIHCPSPLQHSQGRMGRPAGAAATTLQKQPKPLAVPSLFYRWEWLVKVPLKLLWKVVHAQGWLESTCLEALCFAFHQGHFAQVFLCKFGVAKMQMKAQLHFPSPLIFS